MTRNNLLISTGLNGLLALVCLFIVYFCARGALSDILINQVDYHLTVNESEGAKFDGEAWKKEKQRLNKCMDFRPESAHYLESSERFYQTLDTVESAHPELVSALGLTKNIDNAYKYAKLALQLRPTSGYLWKELLLSKTGKQEYDKEMSGAFERVYTLGGWNGGLLYQIIRMGVDNWSRHDDATQQTVVQAMERFMGLKQSKYVDVNLLYVVINAYKVCPTISNQQQKFPLLNAFCTSPPKLTPEKHKHK